MTGVRVKPLAWAGDNSAMTPFGGYSIGDRPGPRDDWDHFGWSIGDDSDGEEFASPDAAKAAAQADYETRILAALEPQATSAIASEAPERLWLDVKFRELFLPGEEQHGIEGLVEYRRAALEPQDAPAVAEELVALRAENARLSEERDANEVERVSLWCQRDKMKAALDAMVLFFEADEAADEARRAGNEADAERYAAMAIGRWQNIPSLIDAALTPPASQEGQADAD